MRSIKSLQYNFSAVFRPLVLAVALAVVCVASSVALDRSHYASSSALSSGRWVKVRVSGTGMHRVSATQLKSMGFKDASRVNVYGYGGNIISSALTASQPDDLPMQPVVRLSDGGIVFYGVGTVAEYIDDKGQLSHEQNYFSTASYYYLSDRETDKTTPEAIEPSGTVSGDIIDAVPVMVVHERELEAAGPTGRILLGEDFRSVTKQNFSLEMPGRRAETPVELTVRMAAKSAGGTNVYSVTANGAHVGDVNISGLRGSYSEVHSVLDSLKTTITPLDNSEKLDIEIAYTPSGAQVVYMSRLDFIKVTYTRSLHFANDEIAFAYASRNGDETLRITGGDATTQLWDVTDAAAPRRINVTPGSDGSLQFNAFPGARKYIVFTPAGVTDEVSGSVQVRNQDLHALETPDMVIISPEQFQNQALRIAQMHSDDDGMDVVVLKPEDVYNEFSSGSPDASAFRKLMKMWYDRDPEKIKYCLLMGRATYDNRQLTATVKNAGYPRLPIWQSVNSSSETSSFCSDNFIGMLDDCERLAMGTAKVRVAVGRMPVKNASEATQAVDKLINYVESSDLGSWRNQVMVIADDADGGDHLRQAQKVISAMEGQGNGENFMYERLYLDSYPLGTASTSKSYPDARKRMFKILNDGVGFIDFIGHGNPTSLTHENLLTYTDVTSMTNKRLPIMLAATCEFMRFDSDNISAAEIMWLNNKGGTIAFIAANRKVYITQNGMFNEAIGKNFFRRDAEGHARRLGDVYIGGLNDYPSTDDNRHRYALMGDPALKVVSPELSVTIDEIDGVALADIHDAGDYPVLTARSKVKVKGRVTDADGALLADFNGRVVPTVFDAERAITTYGHPSVGEDDGKVMTYNDRKNRLFTGSFAVKGGLWEATVIIPEEIDNNYSPALLNMYAYSDDLREANGATTQFYVYGYAEDSEDRDTTDPEILGIGLNSYMFRDGGIVNSSPLFVAKVRDDSGINISSSGIGKQMTLIVDGRRVYEDLVDQFTPDPDDYLAGEVQYTIPTLDDGDHQLMFTVWDNAGNNTSRTLDFKVKSDMQPSVNVYTDASPATAGVTFYVAPDLPLEGTHCHIGVYDLSGRMIWDAQAVDSGNPATPMQARWDLTDRGGARVARGIYIYRCTVTDGKGGETVVAKKLAVAAP